MSDARAIEAVTETLRSLVDLGVKEVEAGAVVVAQPPDTLRDSGQDVQVNLFLYQAVVDGALRNTDPTQALPGETGEPALPLVLHYLLTPFVRDGNDIQAHRMLGGALRVLHEHTVLSRTELAEIAPYSDVSRQVERIRISWQPLEEKDIFSLWSIFQTPYRISTAFEARVVLIDSRRGTRAPLPVLRRGPQDQGPVASADPRSPFPSVTAAAGPANETTARPGDDVVLHGTNLPTANVVVLLSYELRGVATEVAPAEATAVAVRFAVPDTPETVPAGVWSVSLGTAGARPPEPLTTAVGLAIAPRITSPMPMTVDRDGDGTAVVDLTCEPFVQPTQDVFLLIGAHAVRAEPIAAATDALTFRIERAVPGDHLVRLRVDRVDSRLIDRAVVPPAFDTTQTVTVT